MIKCIPFGSKYYPVYNQPSGFAKQREFEGFCDRLNDEYKGEDIKQIFDVNDRMYPFRGVDSPNKKIDDLIESWCTFNNIKIYKKIKKTKNSLLTNLK